MLHPWQQVNVVPTLLKTGALYTSSDLCLVVSLKRKIMEPHSISLNCSAVTQWQWWCDQRDAQWDALIEHLKCYIKGTCCSAIHHQSTGGVTVVFSHCFRESHVRFLGFIQVGPLTVATENTQVLLDGSFICSGVNLPIPNSMLQRLSPSKDTNPELWRSLLSSCKFRSFELRMNPLSWPGSWVTPPQQQQLHHPSYDTDEQHAICKVWAAHTRAN